MDMETYSVVKASRSGFHSRFCPVMYEKEIVSRLRLGMSSRRNPPFSLNFTCFSPVARLLILSRSSIKSAVRPMR